MTNDQKEATEAEVLAAIELMKRLEARIKAGGK